MKTIFTCAIFTAIGIGAGALGTYAALKDFIKSPGEHYTTALGDSFLLFHQPNGQRKAVAQVEAANNLNVANNLIIATTSANSIRDPMVTKRLDRLVANVVDSGLLENVRERDTRELAMKAGNCWAEKNGSLDNFELCFQSKG